jgi:hypothetical protein
MSILTVLIFVAECLVFLIMQRMTEYDPEGNFSFDGNERGIVINLLLLNLILSIGCFSSFLDQLFFAVFLTMLLVSSITDHRTKQVYRVFSVSTVLVGVVYILLKLLTHSFPEGRLVGYLLTLVGYAVLLLLMNKFKVVGLGDMIILAAVGIFLPIFLCKTPLFLIEGLLVHFIVANIVLLVTNVTNINWRKFKPKSEIAFVPDIYVAVCAMMAAYLINPDIYSMFIVNVKF